MTRLKIFLIIFLAALCCNSCKLYKVSYSMTERTFVAAGDDDTRHYRPDRIVWTAYGHIDIVDYKFGEEESSRYLRQVGRYVHYVSGMFPGVDVRGYLWYPLQGTIIEV